MPNYGASVRKQKENLKFDGNGKYTLHNLHWHAFQISCLTSLLSWWKGNTFLVSSRKRTSHCGYRRLNDSRPRSTVLFLTVANYWKFIRLQMPFLLSNIDSKIGRERSLKYLLQTEKKIGLVPSGFSSIVWGEVTTLIFSRQPFWWFHRYHILTKCWIDFQQGQS